jgi:hypothetical protein
VRLSDDLSEGLRPESSGQNRVMGRCSIHHRLLRAFDIWPLWAQNRGTQSYLRMHLKANA